MKWNGGWNPNDLKCSRVNFSFSLLLLGVFFTMKAEGAALIGDRAVGCCSADTLWRSSRRNNSTRYPTADGSSPPTHSTTPPRTQPPPLARLSRLGMKSTHQMSGAGRKEGREITNSRGRLIIFLMFVFFGFSTGWQPVDCPRNKHRQAGTGSPTAHWLWWGMDLINYRFECDLSCLILWAIGRLCVRSSQASSQMKINGEKQRRGR